MKNSDAKGKLAYARPTASFVELEPEERLMSCAKSDPGSACDDPIGGGMNVS